MKRYLFAAGIALALIAPAAALAQTGFPSGGSSAGFPSGGQAPAANCSGNACSVPNPLSANSFCGLIKNILQAAIAIGIPVAVLFIVYAGFKFVLARGNPEKLAEARMNFLWTVIGIAIFLGAWLLANVVANTVNALGGNQSIISCN